MNVRVKMTERTSYRIVGVLLTVAAAVIGVLATYVSIARVGGRIAAASDTATGRATSSEEQRLSNAQDLSNMFGTAAQLVLPSVVQIKSVSPQNDSRITSDWPSHLGAMPFNDSFDESELGADDRASVPTLGCGVVIDPAGGVLTNNHIVEDGGDMIVELPDGRQFRVKDVKADPQTDLALLTLDCTKPLPAAQLGDSDILRIGDWVLTIGSPLGLEQTVSAGIISAKGRSVDGAGKARLLQTDAAINPGSSGGALVNLRGELVGITTAIASRDGGYQGVGFAIPIDLAKWVTSQLRNHGRVRRGYLGASFAARLGSRELDGAMELRVARVIVDSPAQRAGLREGDAVISIDGQPTGSVEHLNEFVERGEIGSQHRLEIVRDQARTRVEITIEEASDRMPSRNLVPPARESRDELVYSRDLGIVVGDVSVRIAEQLGMQSAGGVVVIRTDRGGFALRAGIRKGMVIVRVGNRLIRTTSEFAQIMENESLEAGIRVHVHGRGGPQIIDIGGPDS